ncbi:MAG: phosphoserine aminotransferase, partial [Gammaproteobacteria bacterium]
DADTRSSTSICLRIVADWFLALDNDTQAALTKQLSTLLEKEGAAYDINGYRSAPPGLRIWGGATVEASDVAALLPWLEWAYATVAAGHGA